MGWRKVEGSKEVEGSRTFILYMFLALCLYIQQIIFAVSLDFTYRLAESRICAITAVYPYSCLVMLYYPKTISLDCELSILLSQHSKEVSRVAE